MAKDENTSLVISEAGEIALPPGELMPPIVSRGGRAAEYAFGEYFFGELRPTTRRAYLSRFRRFEAWAETRQIELVELQPGHITDFLENELSGLGISARNGYLAMLRKFFDCLVVRHAIVLNPARSVTGERLEVLEGLTPEIAKKQARQLLDSVDTSTLVGLRDRLVLAILVYTGARGGAVAKLRASDIEFDGTQFQLRFREKGNKFRRIPVRHDVQELLEDYMSAAGIRVGDKAPLLRSARGRTGALTARGISADDVRRLTKRRLVDAGFGTRKTRRDASGKAYATDYKSDYRPHSFRVTTITDLIEQGIPLEDVQNLVGHKDARTTKLYDRSRRQVTRNIVERISI